MTLSQFIKNSFRNSIALDEELKTSIHHASQDGKTKASLSYYKEEEKIICNVEIEVNQLHQNQHQMIQFIKFDCLQFFIKEQLGL
ncbi:unnamed protein product [Paramecium sonneborni]|uniref:Uncharacterized protein n=1 Tax=Paramecium sonneborni TaxID=65129 RepID=A0A8S1PWG8_9CILI|nr:unnamed protein product [Paramecium sonneborni]